MAERAAASHPDRELVFLCYACATVTPEIVAQAVRGARHIDDGIYEPWMKRAIGEMSEETVVDFLRKKSPQ